MFGTRYPIIQAPMAGGTTTPELVAAVSRAGGLGSVGAAYLTPTQITETAAAIRRLTDRPFTINLFTVDQAELDRDPAPMLGRIAVYHRELGLPDPVLPERPAQSFEEQMSAVLAARPDAFSFTFGIPEPEWLAAFGEAGVRTVGTATGVREAVLLEAARVDAIVVQGEEAGGHRGTFMGAFEDSMFPTLQLVREVVREVRTPVIAAGGIMDGAGVRAALDAGAAAAQVGTAFIPCPESGAAAAYKAAVLAAEGDDTTVTRVFSGRHARGMRNRVLVELEVHEDEVLPYPWQNAATKAMRAAAALADRAEYLSLWAGRNVAKARAVPAGELVELLAREAGLT